MISFSKNVNFSLFGIGLSQKLFSSLKKYLFGGYWKWRQINQIAHRAFSSNLWWLRSAKHVKFTVSCEMYTENHVLIKKMFTNGLNIGLPFRAWVKKWFMEWKHTDFPVKKRLLAQQSVKKVMMTVFWDMKELPIINFLEKGATVNSVSYC